MLNDARLPPAAPPAPPQSGSASHAVRAQSSPASSGVERKTQQNAAILQASLDVSIQSKNEPLALLLQSAIARINELLEPQFGAQAIETAAASDTAVDTTAAGTASRIVSLSTGFFDAFKQRHTGENGNDVLRGCENLPQQMPCPQYAHGIL